MRKTWKSEKSNWSRAALGPAILWANLLRIMRGIVRAATALAPSMKESASCRAQWGCTGFGHFQRPRWFNINITE